MGCRKRYFVASERKVATGCRLRTGIASRRYGVALQRSTVSGSENDVPVQGDTEAFLRERPLKKGYVR
jgi:hypothetical protein